MKRAAIIPLALVTIAPLPACSTRLKVSVAQLDAKYFETTEFLEYSIHEHARDIAHKLDTGRLGGDRKKLIRKTSVWADKLQGANYLAPADNDAFAQNYHDNINAAYFDALDSFNKAIAAWNSARNTMPTDAESTDARARGFELARSLIHDGRIRLRALETEIKRDSLIVEEQLLALNPPAGPRTEALQAREEVVRAAEAAAQGIIADYGIFEDPYASAVVYAPPEFWYGTFNEAYGYGSFGDVDIAIVMNNIGDFSVKGVRNDTGAVTAATFHVLRQSIRISAAAAGVPVPDFPAADEPSDAADTAQSSQLDRISTAKARQARATAGAARIRDAMLLLLESVAAPPAELDAQGQETAASRATRLQNAKSTFTALKPTLEGSD